LPGIRWVDFALLQSVDRVRDLVAAQYAALGIVTNDGRIERFITSGVTDEQRAAIGSPPHGKGILGLIIDEGRSFLIDDIARDPRRYGVPEDHPEMHSFLGVPVLSRGNPIGNLYLTNKLTSTRFTPADLELVEMFALHSAIAIENARLHEEVQRLAIVEERQRISQDLHDSIIQSLYAISLSLDDLPETISQDPIEGAARADRAIDSIHGTIRDIRNLIMGLQPVLLEDSDLGSSIQALATEFRANTMIDLEVHVETSAIPVEGDVAAHALAITREALSNIARHSGASRASIEITEADARLRLVISDNGRGFDISQSRTASQHGLTNLRTRAEGVAGSLSIASEPGAGTRVEAQLPTGATA
jgi:signal transduction histidine kinase